jgi:3-demethoxyubiquinol 3-hydroxylase|tara:strand:+ start:2603 stop:3127 length:525 start_codon:yes stop_codon:yes gene_type:complete
MKKIEIPEFLIPDFRSNHAGEIGAVYIYKTAIICAISAKSRQMSKDHLKTEENHLQIIKDLVEKKYRSKLIPIWIMAAIILGFFGSIFGHRFFCLTIYGVENFVKDHYQEQIDKLKNYNFKDLQNLIIKLRSEEIEHMQDGLQGNCKSDNFFAKLWIELVYKGSKKAVNIAKKY